MNQSKEFLHHSIDFLEGHYLPKIEQSVASLTDEDIWWRPNEDSNSIGNLMLHLSGNIRQWIIGGIGKEPDKRVRQEEFDTKGGMKKDELVRNLRTTIQDACNVLRSMSTTTLEGKGLIQGKEVSLLYAIYHVVEHCSMHAGQIIQIAKQRSGKAMNFYGFDKGKPLEKWRNR